MLLRPAPISSDRFTYLKDEKVFAAEASDLPRNMLGRVFDDACDLGFTMISARTGVEMVFVQIDTLRDREGELMYHVFAPATPQNGAAAIADVRVHIFND
jgi:hypothetical protein